MFEQDYVMRLIKETIRAILKLLFRIDTESPTTELLQDAEDKCMLEKLLDMVDEGRINEAENRIYEITENGNLSYLEVGLLFYSYVNDKEDAFLEVYNFSRTEVKQGVKELASRYGLGGMAEMFLIDL